MDAWLTQARDAVAAAARVPASELGLSDEEAGILLARIAAHESGERTNASLLCYLVGRTQGEAHLETLAAAVRSTS